MASINLSNTEKTKSKTVYTELSTTTLKDLLKKYENTNMQIIIKFGATWCGPCQKIKTLCNKSFLEMPDNILCFDLDVDDNMDLFGSFKSKKMIKSIPSILSYNCNNNSREQWYISDTFISGSNEKNLLDFFKNIYTQSQITQ